VRPFANPDFNGPVILGTPAQWFNPAAFSLPPVGEFGNFGRDVLTGPFFWEIDFSAIKDTKLSERYTLQFRAELFNIFNHSNWGLPNAQVFTQGFNAAGQQAISFNPVAGQITTIAAPMRQIQFALRLMF